jgi:CheY-like chemotaxis protein
LKKKRVLVVDDASTNRKICRRMLQSKFAIIDEAENGQEAIDKYLHSRDEQKPYAAIMMDYQMPIMNGLEATKIIKSFDNPPIVVGVTGNGLQRDIDVFMEAGADTVMIKPINIDEFVSFIAKI